MFIYDQKICSSSDPLNLLIFNTDHLQPGDRSFFNHTHSNLEINFIESGSGEYTIDGNVYTFSKGDLFVINNIEPHWITKVDAPGPMTVMVLHFEPRLIWSIDNALFDLRYLNIFFDRTKAFCHRIDSSEPLANPIRTIFHEMEEEFANKLQDYDLMVKAKLLNLLVLLSRHYGCKSEFSAHPRQYIASIQKVVHYIDQHLDQEINLETLAKIACMSSAYFSSYFKRLNGLSPMQYLAAKRIYRSIDYLKATDKSILEIALLCGFNNTPSFYRAFHKITSGSPSDYR